jgi:hypothetical protein
MGKDDLPPTGKPLATRSLSSGSLSTRSLGPPPDLLTKLIRQNR